MSRTVATVGHTTITRSTLNHWMSTVVGGDYNQVIGKRAPGGLVAEPADYQRCVSAARGIVPQLGGKPKLSDAQLLVKCRLLRTAIKEQALSYLIAVLWRAEEGAELGANVSDAEITRQLQEVNRQKYKSPAEFARYLADRRWSIGDERYLLKRNMLDTKFLARLKAQQEKLGGGQQALVKLVHENIAKWTSKTNCRSGYRAWQCRQYRASHASAVSPSVLLERFRAGA